MKSEAITFENMVAVLIRTLPELKPVYDGELQLRGEEIGQHIIYRYVMYAEIERQLKLAQTPDEPLLRRLFSFLEILANHPEEAVQEVAHNSVCEKICSDEVVLQKAMKYAGKRTKEFCGLIIGPARPTEQ